MLFLNVFDLLLKLTHDANGNSQIASYFNRVYQSFSTACKVYISQYVACFLAIYIRCCYGLRTLPSPVDLLMIYMFDLINAGFNFSLISTAFLRCYSIVLYCIIIPAFCYFIYSIIGSFLLTFLLGGNLPYIDLSPATYITNCHEVINILCNTPVMPVQPLPNLTISDAETIYSIEAHLKSATYSVKPEATVTPTNLRTFTIVSFVVTLAFIGVMFYKNS